MGFDQFSSNSERLQAEAGDTLHSPRRHEREQKSRSYGNGENWQSWKGGTRLGTNPFAANEETILSSHQGHDSSRHDYDTSIEHKDDHQAKTSSREYYHYLEDMKKKGYNPNTAHGIVSYALDSRRNEYSDPYGSRPAGTSSSVENTSAIDNDVSSSPKIALIRNLVYSDKKRLTPGDVKEAIKSFTRKELKMCKKYAISEHENLKSSKQEAKYKQRFDTIIICINERLENNQNRGDRLAC